MVLPVYGPIPAHLRYKQPNFCEKLYFSARDFVFYEMDLSSFVQINALRTPKFDDYTYLLGACYCTKDEKEVKDAAKALVWCTYRTCFPAIGGDGPTSDKGWGCMLRCGQMLIAEALQVVHLGRGWEWTPNSKDETYRRILKMFQDKRTSLFSIQQIAQMGVNEGKRMCEWFGPNTIAQVLKKLAIYDDWAQMAVHVAMDNLMIASDIRILATSRWMDVTEPEENKRSRLNSLNDLSAAELEQHWRPVLILVPLRLGLTSINRAYLPAIQAFFKLPQCVGIVGGRPNHAVYFIGFSGEELYYLDPHTAQYTVDLDKMTEKVKPDSNYLPEEDTVKVEHEDTVTKDSGDVDFVNEELLEKTKEHDDEEPEMLGNQADLEVLEIEENSHGKEEKARENENDEIEEVEDMDDTTTSSYNSCEDKGKETSFETLASNHSNFEELNQTESFAIVNEESEEANDGILDEVGIEAKEDIEDRDGDTEKVENDLDRAHLNDETEEKNKEEAIDEVQDGNDIVIDQKEGSSRNDVVVDKTPDTKKSLVLEEKPSLEDSTTESTGVRTSDNTNNTEESNEAKEPQQVEETDNFDDSTFHCNDLLYMHFDQLDPSLALGFICKCPDDFNDLMEALKTQVLPASDPPIFEILDQRPSNWPEFIPYQGASGGIPVVDYEDFADPGFDSDDNFEILE